MKVIETTIPDVVIFEPKIFGDHRGFFFESYQEQVFESAVRAKFQFVQDNHSGSSSNILRGLHYQVQCPQGKLVRVVRGRIYDVAVDLRRNSPTFGRYVGAELSDENRRMLWVPPGFAHGFLTLTDWNEVLYKATDFYAPEHERCIKWDDPSINIDWPLNGSTPMLSQKDSVGRSFREAELF